MIFGIIIGWLVLGFFNWCTSMGYWTAVFPHYKPRDFWGINGLLAVMGPIGTIILLFLSNFYEHGFRLR